MSQNLFRIGVGTDGVAEKIHMIESAQAMLDGAANIEVVPFTADRDRPITTEEFDAVDVVIAGGQRFTSETLSASKRGVGIVRYGAGFDRVDVEACTKAGVILATTPEGIRRPMATAAVMHILVLATRLMRKRQLMYENRWPQSESIGEMGLTLTGKSIGYVGFGNIGQDLYRLLQPFQVRNLVFDPYLNEDRVRDMNIERVDLPTLMSQSDFVVVLCNLTEETRHLIGTDELARMKSSAYFVNVARGGIVDQQALTRALTDGTIRGAGLDAVDPEPLAADDPLLNLDNVIVSPHSLGTTDEMLRLCSELCVEAALDIQHGRVPRNVINKDVLETPELNRRQADLARRFG
jgi:phosphoglycerate dehydrogenase-like enzyme